MSEPNPNTQSEKDGLLSSKDLDETSASGVPNRSSSDADRSAGDTGHFELAMDKPDETTALGSGTKLEPGKNQTSKKVPTRVGGYSLGPLLGQGGMGRVFQAEDSSGGSVALKLLSPSLSSSPEALARFKQEGLIASQINHPNIVFVHRVDEEKGTPFIAMELMTGKTLKDLVVDGGPLPYPDAVKLILQCIEGLIEAHCRGMIHRDIKPANCYLDEHGEVKIGDFGLARSLVSDSELTQTGAFLGTPLFASPEQLLGQKVDNRSDIYSLSATLYFLLAGKAPFESPNAAQVIARIASSDPPSFESVEIEVPKPLEDIVMKGLSRDSGKRFQSFIEMRDALVKVMAPKPEPASLLRRIVAGVADNFLMGAISTIGGVIIASKAESTLPSEVWSAVVAFVYYFFSEWLFGTSLGKGALHIQVIDKKTCRKPTAWKALQRVLAFLLIGSGIPVVISLSMYVYGFTSPALFAVFAGLQLLAGILGYYVLNTVFWFYHGKKQTLYDWLSGTECQIIQHAHVPSTHLNLPQWNPVSVAGRIAIPERLGRFQITREIVPVADSLDFRWFEGRDQQLDRTVWLAMSSDPGLELEERRSKLKWNRIRFIEEGREANARWFAYVAPDGVPLDHCQINGVQLSWPQTRSLIHQVSGLAEAQGFKGTLPPSSRLWIDRAVRLSLVDFDLEKTQPVFESQSSMESGPHQTPENPSAEEGSCGDIECQDLIASVCRLALSPSHPYRRKWCEKQESTPGKKEACQLDVQALLPARARKLCESLASGKRKANLDQVLHDFYQLSSGPSAISMKTRFLNSVLSLAFLIPVMVVVFVVLLLPTIVYYGNLVSATQAVKTMQALVEDPSFDSANWINATDDQKNFCISDKGKAKIDGLVSRLNERLEKSFNSLGSIEKAIWTQVWSQLGKSGLPTNPNRVQLIGEEKSDYQKAFPSEPLEFQNYNFNFGNAKTTPGLSGIWNEKGMSKALRLIESEDDRLNQFDANSDIPWTIVWFAMGFCVVWSWLTFGGIAQYLTGICFVKRDGRKMGLLPSALRAILIYLPVFALIYSISAWPLIDETDVFWHTQLKRLITAVPFIYLAAILFRSNRTPLDVLTSTAATPR